MVTATQVIQGILRGGGWQRAKARDEAQDRWETVYLFDYDASNKASDIWRATLPLAQLQQFLPTTCRYTYDINKNRTWATVFGGLIGIVVVSMAALPVFQNPIAIVVGLLFGLLPGIIGGFLYLSKFGPKPIWMVRRIWMPENEVAEGDVPPNMSIVRNNYRRAVVPFPHDSSNVMTPLNDGKEGTFEAPAQSMGRLGLHGPEEGANVYFPVVHHATTFFEMLQQRVNKKRMTQTKGGVWPKLAIGSIGLLALGTMGILFFMWVISSDRPPEAATWLSIVTKTLLS